MSLKYAIRLHQNARTFIESAVDYASEKWLPAPTFAAVHLAAGIELLLKARLAMENHQELAKRNGSVSTRQFDEGDFESINVRECLERLDALGVFRLNVRQRSDLRVLQLLRNRAVHYIAPTENEVKAVLGRGLNLFIEIDTSEFSHWDPPHQGRTLPKLIEQLRENEEFVLARLSSIGDELGKSLRPRTHYLDECPHCVQDAVVIQGDYFRCLFCGYDNQIACEVENRSCDKASHLCPECGRQAVATLNWHADKSTVECICCGYFTGKEQKWVDWKSEKEMPRLHADRKSGSLTL